MTLELVFAGLVGGIVWFLLTWCWAFRRVPHIAEWRHRRRHNCRRPACVESGQVVSKVIVPAVVAALLATLVGAVGTWLVYRTTRGCSVRNAVSGAARSALSWSRWRAAPTTRRRRWA